MCLKCYIISHFFHIKTIFMLKTYAAHQPTTKKQKKSTNLMHFQPTKKVFVQLIFQIFFEFCGKTFFFVEIVHLAVFSVIKLQIFI